MSNPPTMKSSSYSVVPLESIDLTIPECDVTDVNRRATPGKFIDCLIISDNSNKMGLRYTSRPLSLGSGEDRANMQIVGGKGFAHLGQFSDETLMVDPESGAIIPVMTSPEKTTPAPSTKSHANSESSMSSSSSSSDQFGVDLKEPENQLTARKLFVTLLLFFINLINYIDRYTTAGVLKEIIAFYKISKSQAGLLQTVFIVAYMFLAPVFGYLGDRYNRVVILIFGITFWSGTTLLGSFVPQDYFLYFLLLRGAVGIGEASYSTVAPTIIADLFSKVSCRVRVVRNVVRKVDFWKTLWCGQIYKKIVEVWKELEKAKRNSISASLLSQTVSKWRSVAISERSELGNLSFGSIFRREHSASITLFVSPLVCWSVGWSPR
jgi:hypothetical protein